MNSAASSTTQGGLVHVLMQSHLVVGSGNVEYRFAKGVVQLLGGLFFEPEKSSLSADGFLIF